MSTCTLRLLPRLSDFLAISPTVAKARKKAKTTSGRIALSEGIELELVQSIRLVGKTQWQHVVPKENFFLRYDFLEAFEQTAAANVSFHYALASENGKPFAAFYFQVIHLSADEVAEILKPVSSEVKLYGIGGNMSEIARKLREEKGMRVLVSGNNFISGEYGVGCSKNADPAKVFAALADTVKVITKTDRSPVKISAILVKDYYLETARKTSDHLRKKRYHRFLVEPEMIVNLPAEWKSFDDYLGAMNKKYRHRAKGIIQKTADILVQEPEAVELEKISPELYALYHDVHLHAKFRLAALGENYFVQMKKKFPEQFHVYAYRLNGKLVGFRSSFRLSTHFEAHFIGFDYALNRTMPVYQRMLYDYVQEGIEHASSKVFLGRTASEMKSNVGAVPHDLVCYIRHRNGFHNQLIRPFIEYLKPTEWIQRNPFK